MRFFIKMCGKGSVSRHPAIAKGFLKAGCVTVKYQRQQTGKKADK